MIQAPAFCVGYLPVCSVKAEQPAVSFLLPSWNATHALWLQNLLHLSHYQPYNFSKAFAVIEAVLQMNGFCSWGALCLFASPTTTWVASSSFLVPPGRFHWLQIHPQTLQRTISPSFLGIRLKTDPSTLLLCWCTIRNLNLKVPLLQQGLIPPPSFPDRKGRKIKGVWRNVGQQWREHPTPGQKKWKLVLRDTL